MSLDRSVRAAVLGLGIIGSRACHRVADACWNRTPKGLPGECATPEAAIADADVISIYLKDAPALRETAARIDSFLKPGQIILNHSTVDLETTLWLEERCLERGCRFLDAPFTGSKLAAESGQLVYYIGGDPELAAEVDDYLSITSKSRIHCGGVGAATVVKLATNLISACTVQAMAEALAIATRHGVQAECLIHAVSQNASGSPLAAMKFPTMAAGSYETHFSLANMGKDSRYALALAAAAQVETPAIAAVSQRMNELCDMGLGDLDYSVLAKPYLDSA
jgi:3-hydroxyisobutyrate dehydrogenase/glyoxylate/succinic semialdehyde reductase